MSKLSFVVVLSVLLLLLATAFANAHSWYEIECCDTQDCFPYEGDVKTTSEGYEIDHKGVVHFVRFDDPRVRPSRD